MAAILTPALALRYLRQLSTDLRAAVVLDDDGAALAGDDHLAAAAAPLVELLPDGVGELVVRVGDGAGARGWALVARAHGATAVLAVGPIAPLELLRHDLAEALAALRDDRAGAVQPAPRSLPALVVDGPSRRVQTPGGDEFAVQTAIFAGMGLFDAVAAGKRGANG